MKYVFALFCLLGAGWLLNYAYVNTFGAGEWYLGCADSTGQEYLIKVDSKPYIRDGFIVIGGDTFITPQSGMTCKIISAKELEGKVKVTPTSNPVI